MRRNAGHCFFHKIERRPVLLASRSGENDSLSDFISERTDSCQSRKWIKHFNAYKSTWQFVALRFFLAILSIFFFTPAFSASFDCGNSFGSIEVSICENSELSALDDQLAIAYRSAVAAAPDKKRLQREHLVWISEIRNECEDATCLELAYRKRLAELTSDSAQNDQDIQNTLKPEAEATPAIEETEEPGSSSDPKYSQEDDNISNSASQPQHDNEIVSNEFHEKGITTLELKLIGLILLINAIVTIYLHKREKLIIYKDYTDAAFTGLAPLCGGVAYVASRFFETPAESARIVGLVAFAILMLFIVRSTYKNNKGLSFFFVMSLFTKMTIVGFYYAIMAMLYYQSGSPRRKGERQSSYEARMRREAKQTVAAMAATTTGFIALSAWVCRNSEFTSLREYIFPPSEQD